MLEISKSKVLDLLSKIAIYNSTSYSDDRGMEMFTENASDEIKKNDKEIKTL